MSYLWHVTLDTGDVRQSPRSEVGDEVIPHLQSMLGTGSAPIPGMPGLRWVPAAFWLGRGAAMLDAGGWGGTVVLPSVAAGPLRVVTMGVAPHALAAAATWDYVTLGLGADAEPKCLRPDPPWLGVALGPASVELDQQRLLALGDLERCLAWAWLESDRG